MMLCLCRLLYFIVFLLPVYLEIIWAFAFDIIFCIPV